MDKESAEYLVKIFQFLQGRRITINNVEYQVNHIGLEEMSGDLEPVATCSVINESGNEKKIPVDHNFRRELSVMLAEVDSLQYNQQGSDRLHELLKSIYREVPVKTENHRVLEELKPYLGYWAAWDSPNGNESFDKVKNLLLAHVRSVEA